MHNDRVQFDDNFDNEKQMLVKIAQFYEKTEK